MKLHVVTAAAALAAAVLSVGSPSAATRADGCPHTDVVFYTTDTAQLAKELASYGSACADYYLSVTPTAAGGPRGGLPITTIRSLGPRFHAMVEVRLPLWASYAATNGWYAAGVELRSEMALAGYDVALGDAWAINEVGEPSRTTMGVDVIRNAGTARRDLLDFLHGLYDGPDGTPDPGVVFAADPLQVTTDLTQYRQDLQSWYSDAAFWEELSAYVRFWGQETYADAGNWGVAGSTLAERSAHLNDYFLHGLRLAEEPGAEAARSFFATAYTPLANASYRWPPPDTTTGIGFGYTDIGLTGMESFVSTQVDALRSSLGDRLGFAVVPHLSTPTLNVQVYDRLAAAIQGSETDPAGACGTSGEWCDTDVAGAWFNEAWKAFDVTPPTVTCAATPATLWPPNGKLVPVHVDVQVSDAGSGPAGFALTGVTTSDGDLASEVAGFEVGTAATDGLLRAERPGTAGDRTYTLTYTGYDAAGNSAACATTVVVPHDQGN